MNILIDRGPDHGTDLVFKHKNGDIWAVQAKCYSPDYDIKKSDIQSFISDSDRAEIQHRLLIGTTDRLGSNAQCVLDGPTPPVRRFLLSDFEKAAIEYPSNIQSLSQAKRKPPPTPYDYQLIAIDNVIAGFEISERGQLIMACGTGKSYTTLWVKEKLAATRTLVLVPLLGLLSQILGDWTFAALIPIKVLCVCSD